MADEPKTILGMLSLLNDNTVDLTKAVATMTDRLEITESIAKRSRDTGRALVVMVVVITLYGLTLGWFVYDNRTGIDKAEAALSAQQETRSQVLCPLYVLFLEAVSKPRPDLTAKERREFEHNADVIRAGYHALRCG